MDPFKILFVCWGNICRSPAAECVLHKMLGDQGLTAEISCDSAGTISAHAGQPPDGRMCQHASMRSIPIRGQSRMISPEDGHKFDLILAMDRSNFSDLEALGIAGNGKAELKLFGEYIDSENPPDIPDPYYGGHQGFETVLDMVEDGCARLIEHVISR
ncbi:MAG: protein tyrosine phosphatase [Opitutaceae bacterium]|nr:protein tyrosine phosphatase [Opitutaceae bacterium]